MFGLMAQNEESAAQAHRNMRMTGSMKRIETNTQLVKIHMLFWKELDKGDVKDRMLSISQTCWRRGNVLTWNLRV